VYAVAFDPDLAQRVRASLAERSDILERKMFGGLAFMLAGNMCCGVIGEDLMVRLSADAADAALDEPHTRPMDFTGRPMTGFVYVAPEGTAADEDVRRWVAAAVSFASGLPPK